MGLNRNQRVSVSVGDLVALRSWWCYARGEQCSEAWDRLPEGTRNALELFGECRPRPQTICQKPQTQSRAQEEQVNEQSL